MSYTVIKKIEIDELKCTLTELVHNASGAQVMHIANDDEENLFNLSFQTRPDNSNGVAHVLEHTVLCGSKHFPVRDPFFSMTRRSLNTFMNALTGSDFTCYPAASQVPKDFYNLLEVYLDAVFYPRLLKKSFLQEGHRLEFSEMEDPSSPLEYKGIVFNEMKGALATGDARLGEAIMQALYPDTTYGVNSGGDPKEIPNLTYEDLIAFHEKYYDPSRCLFFFYGNLPLQPHLDFLEEKILGQAKKCEPLPPIPKQPRFSKPRVVTKHYPLSEDPKEKTLIGFGWLTCSILEQVELLALNVLDLVLMGTDAGPLKMALLKSELCKQADSVMDNDVSEVPYLLVFKGCREDAQRDLEKVVRESLEEIAQSGLDANLVDGAIHQLEMSRMEITGNSSPFGLSLFFRSALLKQHGGNPEDGLRIHTLFETLRNNVKNTDYFPTLIQKYLLDNPHFVQVILEPDQELSQKELAHERKILDALQKTVDPKEVVTQAKDLAEMQEESDNVDILPKVTLKDVVSKGKEFALHQEEGERFNLFHHDCFTNDLIYVDLIFDLPAIAEEDLAYLRLFVLLLPQMGCGGRSYAENLDYILEHVGGAGLSLDLYPLADNPHQLRPSLSIRGKSLARKADKLFPLLHDMVVSADLSDVTRLNELLMQHFYGIENSIQTSSLRYAINLASSGLSVHSKLINSWYGLDYFWKLKEIIAKDPEEIIARMQKIQNICLGLQGGDLVLTCDQANYQKLKAAKFFGLNDIPQNSFAPWKNDYSIEPVTSQGRITASPVAFTTLLFPTVGYTHPDAPALNIASEIMENKTLHKRIREQGGAYGSGAANSILSGHFYFYSYRDPHLVETYAAFQEAITELAAGHFDASDLEEAKLGLFQELDSPTAPGSRGLTTYSRIRSGRNPEKRQSFRKRLLTADKKSIIKAAKEHLVKGIEEGTLVSFASKEFLERENALFKKSPLPLYLV